MLVVKQRSNVTGNGAVLVLSQNMDVYHVLHIAINYIRHFFSFALC